MNSKNTLKELCFNNIFKLLIRGADVFLDDVPPHLIAEVISSVHEVSVLEKLYENNSKNKTVKDISQKSWERFSRRKFSGEPNPGESWHHFYFRKTKEQEKENKKIRKMNSDDDDEEDVINKVMPEGTKVIGDIQQERKKRFYPFVVDNTNKNYKKARNKATRLCQYGRF